MEIKNKFTGEIICSGDFGTIAELLVSQVKRDANLRGANLRGADLEDANLIDANLRGADLRGANLYGASLWGCAGNRSEIKSIFISEKYPITYTCKHLQIGCERHDINAWWEFSDEKIKSMDGVSATEFWAEHKEFVKMVIDKFPATKTAHDAVAKEQVA